LYIIPKLFYSLIRIHGRPEEKNLELCRGTGRPWRSGDWRVRWLYPFPYRYILSSWRWVDI